MWLYENALRDECGYKGYIPVSNLDYNEPSLNSPMAQFLICQFIASTTTGPDTLPTPLTPPYLMAMHRACLETVSNLHTMDTLLAWLVVYPQTRVVGV